VNNLTNGRVATGEATFRRIPACGSRRLAEGPDPVFKGLIACLAHQRAVSVKEETLVMS
jgi:hypothetical protein